MGQPFYPLGVVWRVRDLASACALLHDELHFPIVRQGPGWAQLDNGSTHLRLEQATHDDCVCLELVADDPERAASYLTERSNARLTREVGWLNAHRQALELSIGGWLRLVIAREYNEDELGVLPELPMSLEWAPSAVALLQALLRRVPVSFREGARTRATEQAEALVLERGDVRVSEHEAVRALVRVTPRFQHASLVEVLRDLGHDPASWAPELMLTEGAL